MIFPAAGAVFLPERLPKSTWNRVLMLPREERNSLNILPAFPLKSDGWSSSSGRLKS